MDYMLSLLENYSDYDSIYKYNGISYDVLEKKNMIDYKINLRKRIIYILIGIAVSYLNVIPLSLLFSQLHSGELPDSTTSYFFYNGVRIETLILFFYFTFVVVKPSFIPQPNKYQKTYYMKVLA